MAELRVQYAGVLFNKYQTIQPSSVKTVTITLNLRNLRDLTADSYRDTLLYALQIQLLAQKKIPNKYVRY